MTLAVCIDCGALADGARCPDCLTRLNRDRGSPQSRGYTRQWNNAAKALKRRQQTCTMCGTADDLTVDHIVPKVAGGTDDRSNLQVLCRRCNSAKATR